MSSSGNSRNNGYANSGGFRTTRKVIKGGSGGGRYNNRNLIPQVPGPEPLIIKKQRLVNGDRSLSRNRKIFPNRSPSAGRRQMGSEGRKRTLSRKGSCQRAGSRGKRMGSRRGISRGLGANSTHLLPPRAKSRRAVKSNRNICGGGLRAPLSSRGIGRRY